MRSLTFFNVVLGGLAACVLLQPAAAAEPTPAARVARHADAGVAWPVARFVYKADNKRLSEVLSDFAASQGLAVVIADGVDGVVQANFDTTPNEFLAAISKAYGVIWYFDGAAVYFYPSRAIQSRIFRLKGYNGAQVENLLRSLRLADSRYPLRYDRNESTLLVYGPPRHVELVSAAVESLDVGATESNKRVTRVIPLKFAWATDRTLGEKKLPGVASLVRALYSGDTGQGSAPSAPSTPDIATVSAKAITQQKMWGIDKMTLTPPKASEGANADLSGKSITGNGPRGVRSPIGDPTDAPSVQADEATNSVVINGRRDSMDEYVELIHRLDVKPSLIELEAVIIDVSSDSVDALGVDWSASTGKASVSLTSPSISPLDPAGSGIASSGTFSIGTLWSNAGRELMARVNALAANGKAKVVAKPRVLGVVNRTAIMKESRVANVRVAGNLDVNLFQIEAGTTLQVTPQITSFGPTSRIKLSLYIVDGKFESQAVDSVPIVKHTEITTEAYMREGESLLIGGISVEAEAAQTSGVPGLMKIPYLGAMFRWDGSTRSRSERLFLITPRVVREEELALQSPVPR